MTETAISAVDLGKRYGRRWGLRHCSLEVPAGRVVGLVGPNGAGKSTLMNLAVGLLRPTEGELHLLGERVGPGTVLERVAYIDQEHSLYRDFKVREMLRAGRVLNRRWDERIALDRLGELGIPLDRKVGGLSGGQRAQVALAVALAKKPDLLILDEPVASLDPLARRELMSVLMATKAEWDCTVVLSSHVVSELERLCDHLVVLDRGTVKLAADIDDLLEEHHLLTTTADAVEGVVGAISGEVLHREDDRGAVSLLVRGRPPAGAVHDVQPVNLESLVMHYLSAPGRQEVAA
ncbi:ABC-2 type transport system ATP-binding protein [Saccharopolyspora erythraea NRRL 2338]|uniref:ABC transporter ATP-binding protein n=2 Tax=Saccharopolyspora erythraea TaxID=1836 RepID=A4FQM7_SACEN|nr:ABC transporter ATP-binding protein [Saccharopolyspora erythraea]EQD87733.1 ABC transporter ATP-binding protein [Saccharopolyspora erythraea D]PFG92955.1 ABC-2 type transport system ATP-binding protein [Saccharopolyspora erythraea NRRL 2338]QRK89849.1 ABC transporter ATP-binding protein [Saccharopolyspora erythraea]CAM06352.1 ABC transporter ATP-binding protein [Saccharopolyspora erythraea NRRL 2338]